MCSKNIAVKLCGILQEQCDTEINAREWRLLGQEQDGSQMLSWLITREDSEILNVGIYNNKTKTLCTLHSFLNKPNIIQASVNASHTLLTYVTKLIPDNDSEEKEPFYCPYLLCLLPGKDREPVEIEQHSTKQIFVQYVYGKSHKYSPGIRNDRLLLFKHLEYIKLYRTPMFLNEYDDGSEKWGFDGIYTEPETIIKEFSWSQWDCTTQVLYYIHFRQPAQSFAEGEEVKSPTDIIPTLSALQFHADLPYETVMNIPLNLPHLCPMADKACGTYADDPVPLRIHDCSLDLQIITDQKGLLCLCHHYLYKTMDESMSSLALEESTEIKESGVNFAYSVTVLQLGSVLHTVIPDLPWVKAKALRPSYMIFADQLLVHIPMMYTHLIDISPLHDLCCHFVIPADQCDTGPALAPLLGWGPHAMVDLNTLDVVTMSIQDKDISATFKGNTIVENRIAIIHYLVMHDGNYDLAEELISWACVNQTDGVFSFHRLMQEYLICATHCSTKRSLPTQTHGLLDLLPYTLHLKINPLFVNDITISVTIEKLWNVAAVVLTPRQRVCQFSEDLWTRLWAKLNSKTCQRFSHTAVLDKLAVSLHCYQPEALSRCSTPLSPSGTGGVGPLSAPISARRSSSGMHSELPFHEIDVCTASRQELLIAANVREVSVHLMRARAESGVQGAAARWAAAQLDSSRALCRAIARAAAATPHHNQHKGFSFIDEMHPTHRLILFKLFEQYYHACDSIAFPVPQGFSSFFSYLGHSALPFHGFLQLVHRNALELHIDVMKAIITTKDESQRTVNNKFRLIQLIGDGRAKRCLASWNNKEALVVRARQHSVALLSGHKENVSRRRSSDSKSLGFTLPSGERLSSLDTFLDLLTAKASLNELDFNLIIQATLASMQEEKT